MKPKKADVERVLQELQDGTLKPGCKYMAVNRFTAGSQESCHGAEFFLGNCNGFPSGELFYELKDDDALTVALDIAASKAIVEGIQSQQDHLGQPIPDFENYSVNISLALLRSPRLYEAVQIYMDGLDSARLIFELPEGMNQTSDIDAVILLTHAHSQIRLAIDDLYGQGSQVNAIHLNRLRQWLVWLKIDFGFWTWARSHPAYMAVIVEELQRLQGLQCRMVIEGIETEADKKKLASELAPASVPGTVYIQGFGVHCPLTPPPSAARPAASTVSETQLVEPQRASPSVKADVLKADVLLVTAAEVESRAVLEIFKQATGVAARPIAHKERVFHDLGVVNGVRVYLARTEAGSGGMGGSQESVRSSINAVNPSAVIMVGIAFGMNQTKQRIGDVLVSKQLSLYELQRVGNEIVLRGDKPHCSTRLYDYLSSANLSWDREIAKIRFGVVLTGDKLVDNIDFRTQLNKLETEAIGGEMEGAGLYVACAHAGVQWILVKAICDWGDGNKNDDYQVQAAHNSAAFVLYALQHASFGPMATSPQTASRESAEDNLTSEAVLHAQPGQPPPALEKKTITKSTWFRAFLDHHVPRLHHWLTMRGVWPMPAESELFNTYLERISEGIDPQTALDKEYATTQGKNLPHDGISWLPGDDPFIQSSHLHRRIREVLSVEKEGDSSTAQIASFDRKNRVIADILKTVQQAEHPLILLGDPGTGKTMAFKKALHEMADGNLKRKRVFPPIPLYIRLGEFHEKSSVSEADVMKYVRLKAGEMEPYLDSLSESGRLVIFFDGLDEMSREGYDEHTKALSDFAHRHQRNIKLLFSCRINDFSGVFDHKKLLLLPFDRHQIEEFLSKSKIDFPIKIRDIDGQKKLWSAKQLAIRLAEGDLPIDTNNPFVLWLLCSWFGNKETWPISRVELLDFHNKENYETKEKASIEVGTGPFPPMAETFLAWGRFAFEITVRNGGSAIAVSDIAANGEDMGNFIRVGKICGILKESRQDQKHLIRFEHHRFQEYFTALYLYVVKEKPPISWNEKLDAPRWQETTLNLILMGAKENRIEGVADDAFQALVDSITEPIQDQQEAVEAVRGIYKSKPRWRDSNYGNLWERIQYYFFAYKDAEEDREEREERAARLEPRVETLVADRVELASRVMRQVGTGGSAIRKKLEPILLEAVMFLAERGNPISQEKMMQACLNVPSLDPATVLAKPLQSPIKWIRDQALITVASGEKTRVVGHYFATQLGHDLANGQFYSTVLTYIKAARSTGKKDHWHCIFLASFCYLLSIFSFLVVIYFLHEFTLLAVLSPEYISDYGKIFESWYSSQKVPVVIKSPINGARNILFARIAASDILASVSYYHRYFIFRMGAITSLIFLVGVGWELYRSKMSGEVEKWRSVSLGIIKALALIYLLCLFDIFLVVNGIDNCFYVTKMMFFGKEIIYFNSEWNTFFEAAIIFFGRFWCTVALVYFFNYVASVSTQFFSISAFLVGTIRSRKFRESWSFFAGAWRNHGFGQGLNLISYGFAYMAVFLSLSILPPIAFKEIILPVSIKISHLSHLPFDDNANVCVIIAASALLWASFLSFRKREIANVREILLAIALIMTILALVVSPYLPSEMGWLVAAIKIIWLVYLVLYYAAFFMLSIYKSINFESEGKYPKLEGLEKYDWLETFRKVKDAKTQLILLEKYLNPSMIVEEKEKALSILFEIQDLINKKAADEYWRIRRRIEMEVRQNKQG